MKIEVVGSGGAFSDMSTAFLINDHVLIDCGDSIVKALLHSGRLDAVDTVFLTHKHFDHLNGMEAFVAYKVYVQKSDFKIVLPQDAYALLMQSNICTKVKEEFYPIQQRPVASSLYTDEAYSTEYVEGLQIIAVKTQHADLEAFGYAIMSREGNAYFSGDVDDYAPLTPEAFSFFDMIFHDVGWTGLPDTDTRVHPFEDLVAKHFGYPSNLYGVHTDKELVYLKQAKTGNIFHIGEQNGKTNCTVSST